MYTVVTFTIKCLRVTDYEPTVKVKEKMLAKKHPGMKSAELARGGTAIWVLGNSSTEPAQARAERTVMDVTATLII